MKTDRDFTRLLPFCPVGVLLVASMVAAQTGIPEVPTGTGPHGLAPTPDEPSISGVPGAFALWNGPALRSPIQSAWPFLSVVPPTLWFQPAALREPRGPGLPVSRAAAGRLVKR